MHLGGKSPALVVHDDDTAPCHRGDVRCAAASRQARTFAVFRHPVSVQIPKSIDFRAANKSQIDPSLLQQVHHVIKTAA